MDAKETGKEGWGATTQLIADNTKNFLIISCQRHKTEATRERRRKNIFGWKLIRMVRASDDGEVGVGRGERESKRNNLIKS